MLSCLKDYLWDYIPLCCREFRSLEGEKISRFMFAGTGSFPVTVMLFNLMEQIKLQKGYAGVTPEALKMEISNPRSSISSFGTTPSLCIDIDEEALIAGEQLFRRLEHEKSNVDFVCGDIHKISVPEMTDFLHIASMIPHKYTLLEHILKHSDTASHMTVLVRRVCSRDPRSLFYEPLDKECIQNLSLGCQRFEIVEEFNPELGSDMMTGFFRLRTTRAIFKSSEVAC